MNNTLLISTLEGQECYTDGTYYYVHLDWRHLLFAVPIEAMKPLAECAVYPDCQMKETHFRPYKDVPSDPEELADNVSCFVTIDGCDLVTIRFREYLAQSKRGLQITVSNEMLLFSDIPKGKALVFELAAK